jgi:hypothetical protein
MNKISYTGYRFPPEIIHQTVWLYLRFTHLHWVLDMVFRRRYAMLRRHCHVAMRRARAVYALRIFKPPLCFSTQAGPSPNHLPWQGN